MAERSGLKIDLKISQDHIEINYGGFGILNFNYFWLRENCRCTDCYSHVTNQRIIDILDIKDTIKPLDCTVHDKNLIVHWNDGHQSEYPLSLLEISFKSEILPEPKFWNAKGPKDVAVIKRDTLSKENAAKQLVQSLLVHGVGFVNDVEPTIEATEQVVTSLFEVQKTFFGEMWTFANDLKHYDLAYSEEALAAHNDGTYFTDGAGLQVFHTLVHEGTGGETLLVDGFRAVHQLGQINSEYVNCLKNVPVESIYIDSNRHHSCVKPLLQYDSTNQLKQIRFNNLDRSDRPPITDTGLFYKSLRGLTSCIKDPNSEWWLKLQPGTVAFINNWRVLHGRSKYTGYRKMGGCYVAMTEFLSKARVLKVIK